MEANLAIYAISAGPLEGPELVNGDSASDAVANHYNDPSSCLDEMEGNPEDFWVSAALLDEDLYDRLTEKMADLEPEEVGAWLDDQPGVVWERVDVTWRDGLALARTPNRSA